MRKFIEELARASGRILLSGYGKIKSKDIEEKSRNEFVTHIDVKSEKFIRQRIRDRFPGHTVVGEEEGGEFSKQGFEWIIDPLDGTHNFIHGLPFFCVSLALAENGIVKYGVIFDPVHDELYSAEKGQGCFLNRKKITVSETTDLSKCFLATGYPFRAHDSLDYYLQTFKEIMLNTAAMRRAGSAAMDLCYTAKGTFDGFWELSLKLWDIAAGILIVEEAGGKVSPFTPGTDYMETGNIFASNPHVHEQLLQLIRKHPFPVL